jgi:ketosteroid isomerase-like protein
MDARDVEVIRELVRPDAEWIPDPRIGEAPVRGLESIIRYFNDIAEMFEDLRTETERLWDADGQVLAFVRVTGKGQASGAGFDIRIAHLWTLSDGLLIRGESYGNRDEGLAAAGLAE